MQGLLHHFVLGPRCRSSWQRPASRPNGVVALNSGNGSDGAGGCLQGYRSSWPRSPSCAYGVEALSGGINLDDEVGCLQGLLHHCLLGPRCMSSWQRPANRPNGVVALNSGNGSDGTGGCLQGCSSWYRPSSRIWSGAAAVSAKMVRLAVFKDSLIILSIV